MPSRSALTWPQPSPGGELIWVKGMVWDEQHNLIITEARFVPQGFFRNGLFGERLPDCG